MNTFTGRPELRLKLKREREIARIARLLGITVDELVDGLGRETAGGHGERKGVDHVRDQFVRT